MQDIEILGNQQKGLEFIKQTEQKKFIFSLVISYTATSEIPGITMAGEHPDLIKFTGPADAEFIHYGYCRSISVIPMTPDGKPTPALLTKTALEAASIPSVVVNAGSKVSPKLPFIDMNLNYGKNIGKEPALSLDDVGRAVEYGRIIGRFLGASTDCVIVGESIPGGTTTALGVLEGFGITGSVSSSMPQNPVDLKIQTVKEALKRLQSNDPFEIISQLGDPMIPTVAGILSTASEISRVLLAGGTQMAAVLAFAKSIGFEGMNTAVGTTSYVSEDKSANLSDIISQIMDVPILVARLKLAESEISGLSSYAKGFVKEGAGAGGSSIGCMLKTGLDAKSLLALTEKEYLKIT
ncbi:MAG: TIGR00303 family protein [Thaumarchaeota archaeon]|nr:TIGR00303 family protein [Nitrososphaerota archaeon]MDE1832525.1 TIGR00303 family protein [Nitrososphaerota archaeon]MDE1877512.1 TIGR00303 family protein [Nitrososphaerota archaeon]